MNNYESLKQHRPQNQTDYIGAESFKAMLNEFIKEDTELWSADFPSGNEFETRFTLKDLI